MNGYTVVEVNRYKAEIKIYIRYNTRLIITHELGNINE